MSLVCVGVACVMYNVVFVSVMCSRKWVNNASQLKQQQHNEYVFNIHGTLTIYIHTQLHNTYTETLQHGNTSNLKQQYTILTHTYGCCVVCVVLVWYVVCDVCAYDCYCMQHRVMTCICVRACLWCVCILMLCICDCVYALVLCMIMRAWCVNACWYSIIVI